jgi:tripartite ATP-independent transporter DctM subunit
VTLFVLIIVFVVLMALNVPIAFCLGIATVAALLVSGDIPAFLLVAHRMATGIDSFALLAIPFFILSGSLMGRGGIARRLIDFAEAIVGRFPGGLAYVNVLTCMLFGSISGSAAAAVSSVGGFTIPVMNQKGYNREFNGAVTLTAATTGLLIPPSNIMIVYSLATGGAVSIAAIFVAGILPGIVMGLALLLVSGIVAWRHGYGHGEKIRLGTAIWRFVQAVPALLLVIIVLGGILGGIFTATEASAIAVVYSLILAVLVYREVRVKELPAVFLEAAVNTSVVMLLIGTSMAMSWLLAYENIPQQVSATLINLTDNPLATLLIMNLILLAVGTFMDMTPALLIFTPIFLPVATDLGVDPIHFGVWMIMNLCIGICTPPVGTCLFLGCGIAQTTVTKIIPRLLPFYAAMVAVLLLTTYWPDLSLVLPRWFGLTGG